MDAEAEPGRLIDQDAFFNMSQSTKNAPMGLWFCADGSIGRAVSVNGSALSC
jgi:hypothetical protein